jgi:hypothetical protein
MNMATRIAAALTLVCGAIANSQTAQGPPVPYEDPGACPFEGCVYREWQANAPVDIHAERRIDSAVIASIAKGERVQALTGVVVTIKAGRIQSDTRQELVAEGGPLVLMPGQTLYLLTYLGEGHSKAWFNQRLYKWVDASTALNGACQFVPERCKGWTVERPQSQWWVQIKTASGKVGWTLDAGKFDNTDRYG